MERGRRASESEVVVRICLVSRELSPLAGERPGSYVLRASRALAAAGHEVHLLTAPRAEPVHEPSPPPGVRVHVLEPLTGLAAMAGYRNDEMRYAMGVLQKLEQLHARHPFDYIEFPEYLGEGSFALRARRTLGGFQPAVLAVRLHTPGHERQRLNRAATLDLHTASLEYQETLSMREAELLLSPTRALLDRVSQRLGELPPGHVLPPPFEADASLGPLPPGSTELARILFRGRLEYQEGLHLLVDAGVALLEKQQRVELWFVGEDTATGPFGQSMRTWLERRIPPALRARFHFEPALSRSERARALREASVFCAPSDREDLPDECLEAMAAGAVVIASSASGMRELLEDGRSGLLFRSGDVANLTAVLERALTDEPLRQGLRQAAPQRLATCCDPAAYVERLEKLVEHARSLRGSGEPTPPARSRAPAPTPDVSILVPYYNMGRYLPETLRSLQQQTFEDYELLLVDDGSTESASRRLLDELEGTRKLRILRKRNGGLSSARNAGLREARGRWILPLDPDDLLAPTFLEKAVDVMSRSPRLGYVTSLVSYFTEDPQQPVGGWVPWGLERDALCLENVASTCTALMERRLVEEVGGYDEWLTSFEDWDVFCGMAERGYEGLVIPEFLFFYRQRPESMTRQVATHSRHALIAYLLQKHPELPSSAHRALRVQLGELQRLQERLTQAQDKPLRYRLVDSVNEAVKQRLGFLHQVLRHTARLGRKHPTSPP